MCQDLERATAQVNGLTKMDENDDTRAAPSRNLQADVKDCLIDQCKRITNTAKQSVSSLGRRLRNLSSGPQRDTKPSTAQGRSHLHHMCVLVVDFMSDACHGHPSRYTLPLSPPPPLSPSSPPPLFPSPSPPLLIGQTFSSHLLCGCVVSGGAFPPPIVRLVFPAPRSHASSLQSCAFLLYPPPPPSTCTEYFLLNDHGIAAFPSLCPHET